MQQKRSRMTRSRTPKPILRPAVANRLSLLETCTSIDPAEVPERDRSLSARSCCGLLSGSRSWDLCVVMKLPKGSIGRVMEAFEGLSLGDPRREKRLRNMVSKL